MSWRRVGVVYATLALLVAVLAVDELARRRALVDSAEPPETVSLLGTTPEEVDGIVMLRGARRVQATRDGERWLVLEPARADIPSDLIEATVATLTGEQVSARLGEPSQADLEAFGLDEPRARLELTMRGDTVGLVRVLLGGPNPPKTAIYAKREDSPTVFLAGGNLRYYLDLIFEAAGPAEAPDGEAPGPGRQRNASA